MVARQYRYFLQISSVNGIPEIDGDGNYTEGKESFATIGMCRDEAARPGDFTTTTDGQKVGFSWLVYAPLGTPDIPYGKTVRVIDESENVRATGTVKRFHRGYYNCRIWL